MYRQNGLFWLCIDKTKKILREQRGQGHTSTNRGIGVESTGAPLLAAPKLPFFFRTFLPGRQIQISSRAPNDFVEVWWLLGGIERVSVSLWVSSSGS